MTNHVYLLLTPQTTAGPSQVMKHLRQRYVQDVNRTFSRTHPLARSRGTAFRAIPPLLNAPSLLRHGIRTDRLLSVVDQLP